MMLRRTASNASSVARKVSNVLHYNGSSRTYYCRRPIYNHPGSIDTLIKCSFSSMVEPEPSLFSPDRLYKITDFSAVDSSETDKQLRADVKTMGTILGNIIKEYEGEEIFNKVETLRQHAKAWRDAGAGRDVSQQSASDKAFQDMATLASSLSHHELLVISRAFSHFCSIANAAEFHHRSRRNELSLRKLSSTNTASTSATYKYTLGALGTQSDSCGGVFPTLLNEGRVTPEQLHHTLSTQQVELVLTAHPTEVNRRTLIDKHRRIQNLLTEADTLRYLGNPTPYQKQCLDDQLIREIGLIWQSDEVSRQKPTVQSEAQRGTLVVEAVLWETLPNFLRKLDATMKTTLGPEYGLPLTAVPIKFSSWMGGDRDGNPNVTPTVTREVCLTNRIRAAKLLKEDIGEVAGRLSTTHCNEELRAKVGAEARAPYRRFLSSILDRLDLTIQWATMELNRIKNDQDETILFSKDGKSIDMDDIYVSKQSLLNDLLLVHRSLCETGNEKTANGKVVDVIRKVCAFGLTLVQLDVRQESTRHTMALDAITRYLGIGSYEQWDEATRLSWLQRELVSNRPLIRRGDWHAHPDIFSDTTIDTLETFEMIAEQKDDSLGAYVISQAKAASDVLAVLLLQRDAGVKNVLRVVPLFETLDDLNGAVQQMNTLFSLPAYKGVINGKQEVMIGYSDSAKDAGRLAASWAQYETQEQLALVAKKHDVELTFFHGKGGSVGRGGNPATFNAILSHAPDTINGRFRVTEQGEMINQNFGHPNRAERSLDIFTAAVCAEMHTPRPSPSKEWRETMNDLSRISCDAYRGIVRGDDRFVPYFRSATPEQELADLNIGSRPAKRKASGGVESLRAIPWIFAWTQTRLNLPTWLGVGEAIHDMLSDKNKNAKLREMYKNWSSFRTTIDLVEMVLAKSEPAIARHYDNVLVKDEKAQELGSEVRAIHANTEKMVLDLTGHTTLCEHNQLLRRALFVRNPYVDCMNVLQVEIMRRLREKQDGHTEDKALLKDALLISITGIANGMGNTG